MAATDYTTINLGLPAVPETTDPKLLPELVRIYNAIKILAQGVDTYTADGSTGTTIASIADTLEGLIDNSAKLAELQKQYKRYTVPKFTVIGPFGCNGKSPQNAVALSATTSLAPAGGTGTAAGGWDTAADRDFAIQAINNNKAVLDQVVTALKAIGILA